MVATIIYCMIGFIAGLLLVENADKDVDKALLCIAASSMIIIWPIYLIYRIYDITRNK